jgi:2-polyprenyl-6-methoxyphenol hydroxylase-like FAD-dependent oxidoreductase
MDGQLDALIIGAGPTGLTLAAQLHALGVSARIVDRQQDRAHESRALAIQPRTLEVLRGLGISQTLVERGNPAVQLRLHLRRRVVGLRLFDVGVDDTAYPFLLFLSQSETEAALTEHLAARGVRVERGVELVAFAPADRGITCTLRHAGGRVESVHARYLVGCDGARSTVREGAGIAFRGGAYPQTFVLGDLEVDGGLEPGAAHAFLGAPGVLLFFPLGRPATWRLVGLRPGAADAGEREQGQGRLSLDELQAITDAFTGGALRLRDPAWLSDFRIHHRHAARYRAGRVFLAGDAAHVHSPAGAQGMNTGIQDAWNLGWKLALVARGVAHEALLDSYEAERLPVGQFVLRFTDRASTVVTSSGPIARAIRGQVAPRLVPVVLRFAPWRAFGVRVISELGIRYRRSPAVEEGRPPPRRGPRAGDRLPDARIARDGRAGGLQEALGAPTFHLLLCGPAEGWDRDRVGHMSERYRGLVAVHRLTPQATPGALHDVSGEGLRRLGVERAAQYLVRPDGHIGFRRRGTDLQGLEGHLLRWLPGAGVRPR